MDFSSISYPESKKDGDSERPLAISERVPVLLPRNLDDIGRYPVVVQAKPGLLVPIAGLVLALFILSAEERLADRLVVADWHLPQTNLSDFLVERQIGLSKLKILAEVYNLDLAQISASTKEFTTTTINGIKDNLVNSKSGLEKIALEIKNNWQNFNPAGDLSAKWAQLTSKIDYYYDQANQIKNGVTFVLDEVEIQTAAVGVGSLLDKNNVNFVTQTMATIRDTRLAFKTIEAKINEKISVSSMFLAETLATTYNLSETGVINIKLASAKTLVGLQIAKTGLASLATLADTNTGEVAKLITVADRQLMASAEYSAFGLQAAAISTRDALKAVWYGVPTAIINRLIEIKISAVDTLVITLDNWRHFLFGAWNSEIETEVNLSPAELREQIRQDVINELEGQMKETFNQLRAGNPAVIKQPSAGENGVVIVPANANNSSADVKSRLQNMFSDPVSVSFDADGQSGVVTPEFRSRTGENYIFLLTPIKK
ncbi:MAG: hypothetical protein A2571_03725 [Candidatus Vogelbacteria bacterium RIFOXYD1_FULL_44_32]|uniref:Uncharacterized protein n=1 Tax=Candidatus Vogelbacteria bacterium RIFOXYD1_FULL_44_32 TaxID=1802438 RepID=A0A1G2QC29_9BACT|nr:MAG: hypothetical protein A2571_03725 [Candidatus Vogelbacteria bacterium RIFOXYD1_FULL_44_32]